MLAILADLPPGRSELLVLSLFHGVGGAALAKMPSWCPVWGVYAGLHFPCPAPTLLSLVRAMQEAKAFSGLLEPKKGQEHILNHDFLSLAVKDPCSGV